MTVYLGVVRDAGGSNVWVEGLHKMPPYGETMVITDSPGEGTHSYWIYVQCDPNPTNTSSNGVETYSGAGLVALVVKK